MAKLPKGFIGEGNGNAINVNCIVEVICANGKQVAIDKFGVKHYVSKNQLKKLEGRFGE